MKRALGILAGVMFLTVMVGAQADKVAAGKKVYDTENCKMCHSIGGQGNKMFPLDGMGAKLSEADTKTWITDSAAMEAKLPKPPAMKMSAVMKSKHLTDQQVDDLVAYIQSLKK